MNKDEVLKHRGEVFDAALREARARMRVSDLAREIEAARQDHSAAFRELAQKRSTADAAEANAVLEVTKSEGERLDVGAEASGIKLLP